jgi:ABC-type glycerol-3-phosphate transport system substrate-binding protein
VGLVLAGVAFALGVGASEARSAGTDRVTISMLALAFEQPALQVLVANFERVYPNIAVDVSYPGGNTALYQVETVELGAGNAPDLLQTFPGRGTPVSVCTLAKAGDLAPIIGAPWLGRRTSGW